MHNSRHARQGGGHPVFQGGELELTRAGSNRHCERSEAIHDAAKMDCFVAALLAMTATFPAFPLHLAPALRPLFD
jgi:hypothetical protein